MWLSRSGWWPQGVAGSLVKETERVAREWRADHEEEGLNPLAAMLGPLRKRFDVRRLAWQPYLFWELAAEMRVPQRQEAAVARLLRDEEAALLGQRRLRGVLFSTVGRKQTVEG
jgi:hypothetical protein